MDWFGLLITALMDWAQCGLPDNRLGLMWPPDNSTYRSGPLTFNPAGASLVLLLGVQPLTLNAGRLAALIEYISSIRIVDSCSCIAECSCSLLTEHSCSHLS